MKELIPKDNYGVFADSHDIARVDSLYVAKYFEKEHKNVLADIRNLDCSIEFSQLNFQPSTYKDDRGKKQPCYYMTRDGFVFLAMGYRGKKAARFKELYIRRFNEMESMISTLITARNDFSELTESIKFIKPDAKAHTYSNECNMLNRIITGYSAKDFRERNGIQKGESIRPYMDKHQLKLLEALQKIDIGLLYSSLSYQERKNKLEEYAERYYAKEKACIPVGAGTHAINYVMA